MAPIKLTELLKEVVKPIPFDENHWQVGISKIPIKAFAWFEDKEPLLSPSKVFNVVELRHRLTWLSEGSLGYQIKNEKYFGPQGNPVEKDLYSRFRRYLAGTADNSV